MKDAINKYTKPLNVPVVFASDGTFFKTWHMKDDKELMIDGEPVNEFLKEKMLLRFINEGFEIESIVSEEVKYTRKRLISVFDWANNLLRKEGIREGFDRFIEFANLLFLKLISEMEIDREKNNEDRVLEKKYCWESFANFPPEQMMEYINGTVLPHLVQRYNHTGDVFQNKLGITNPMTLKQITDKLTRLTLINIESDIKGDAFEYFLKNAVTVGNDLGEYFTPRHIVRLMVKLINPQFGEVIYDPTCGTGGFLIESFRHIKQTCKPTKDNMDFLKNKSVFGNELTNTARIAKMNMILTGDGHTNIKQMDSLKKPVKNKYDVVLANPPYGQTTDWGNLYPVDSNQADPIFVQHIMESLNERGRSAIIVPEGVLFRLGADKKVRRLLLKKFNLFSIISLPSETFRPYARAKTYILIFQKGFPTKEIWFFNIENDGSSLDEKRTPINNNDIPLLISLWENKPDTEKSWSITYEKIVSNDYNLSPWRYMPSNAQTKGITNDEASIYLNELQENIQKLNTLTKTIEFEDFFSDAEWIPLSQLLKEVVRKVSVDPEKTYETIGVRWYGKGVFSHGENSVKSKTLKKIQTSDFIYNKLFAWKGSFDIVGEEFNECYASNEFPTFQLKENKFDVKLDFIKYFFRIPSSWSLAGQFSKGTAKISRNRLSIKDFLNIQIPIPKKQIRTKIISLLSIVEEINTVFSKSEKISSDLFRGITAKLFEKYSPNNFSAIDKQRRLEKY